MENTEGSILDRGSIQSFPTMSPNKKGGSKKLWILIVLIAVAVAAFLFLRPSETTIQKPTPTIEPTTTVSYTHLTLPTSDLV